MAGKKGEGRVQLQIKALLAKKGRTTKELEELTGANRQHIRSELRTLVLAGKVVTKGVPSPQGGYTYQMKRKG